MILTREKYVIFLKPSLCQLVMDIDVIYTKFHLEPWKILNVTHPPINCTEMQSIFYR